MDKPNFGLLRRQASAPRAPRALVRMQRYGGRAVLTTPKSEKVRTITVPALVAVEVRRHLGDHVGEGILFRGLRGAEMLRRTSSTAQRGVQPCGPRARFRGRATGA